MTLILGVICNDGIVVASDSQSTEGPLGSMLRSVRFPTKKIWPLGDSIIWGGSGDGGLTQRVKVCLDDLPQSELSKPINNLRDILRTSVVETIRNLLQSGIFPQGSAQPYENVFLFCGHTSGESWILEVIWNGQDTLYSDRGFHAIGSGGFHAQMAHAMVAHYAMTDRAIAEGQFIVYRVIDAAISTAAAGLDYPVQMSLIQGGTKELATEELYGVRDFVGIWKELETETLQGLLGTPSS